MGLIPTTPEEIAAYKKHIEEINLRQERLGRALDVLGVKPIPKEQYDRYGINQLFAAKRCPKCDQFSTKYPVTAMTFSSVINKDAVWYDWLDILEVINKHLQQIGNMKDGNPDGRIVPMSEVKNVL